MSHLRAKQFRWIGTLVFSLLLSFLTLALACDLHISRVTSRFHTRDLSELPRMQTALVLGCSQTLPNGRSNLYFTKRIEAASQLYHAKRCQVILVSGDNGRNDYDEPTMMMMALISSGVPGDKIFRDFAGFSTLDSLLRARTIFGQKELIVVSQPFHNERAIYIARHHGIAIHGWDAADVTVKSGLKTRARETLARIKTILDLHIFKTEAKFSGPAVSVEHPQLVGTAPPTE